jgi:hypothetical protein
MRIYLSGTDLINKQKELTRTASTNKMKKVFSLMGDLNRIRTSKRTMTEKRNTKKYKH